MLKHKTDNVEQLLVISNKENNDIIESAVNNNQTQMSSDGNVVIGEVDNDNVC